MFITQSQENTEIRKAIVTPLFAYPLYSIIDKDITTEIKAEFFFYSKSLKQEFAVFIRLNNYDKWVVFDFYRSTGEYVFTKRHSILGVTTNDSSKLNVQVSPNGRFIAFIFTTDPAKKGSTIGKVTRNSATKIRRLGSQKSVRSKISDMNEGGSSSFEEAKDSSNSIFQEHTSPFRKLRESKTKNIKINIKNLDQSKASENVMLEEKKTDKNDEIDLKEINLEVLNEYDAPKIPKVEPLQLPKTEAAIYEIVLVRRSSQQK